MLVKPKSIGESVKITILIILAFIQLFPLYWLITFSLKTNAEIFGENILGLPQHWRWVNYITALGNGGILQYFLNSVFYSIITLVAVGLFSAMAAYAIARMKWRMRDAAFLVFSLGIMIPTHAALLPLFQMVEKMGLKGGYIGLLIPYITFGLPMSIMILTGFFKGIPKEMEEAACIDGCGVIKCFIIIILPIVKPALATASVFTFLGTWNELLFANTFIDSSAFRTLPVGIMSFVGQYSTDWGLIGAGMVIATLPTIIFYFLLSEQVQNSLVAGAVKG